MPATAPFTDLQDAIRALSAIGELFHNGDTIATEAAIDAFQAGRAAFASKGVYSNQKAGRLVISANRAGLSYALRNIADDRHASYAARSPYLLGTLIPLNKPAMVALEAAWAEHADGERLVAAE